MIWRDDDNIQVLEGPGIQYCGASAINDLGFAVGDCDYRAMVWTPEGEVIDLNDYLPPDTGFTLTAAFDINNGFQIVGVMDPKSGPHRPFRLTIPEPVSLSPFVDIRPGSCANKLNRRSRGVLPVALLGTLDFDVLTVDWCTLLISRADGVGGAVAARLGPTGCSATYEDVGTPFEGAACECHEAGGDGIIDLSVKFRTQDMVAGLQLDELEQGQVVPLEVTGALLDGNPFRASDCVVLGPG